MSANINEGKLKILETSQKSEEILHFYLIFCVFMDFYCDVFKRNVHVWLGCTKTRNAGIGTVLHLRPPDVQIFGSDPSLPIMAYIFLIIGRRVFGGKDNLWEIICPESYGGVTFDHRPLLRGRMWSLIPKMAYISLIITRGGFGCEDNL